jgi:hypothetical protein
MHVRAPRQIAAHHHQGSSVSVQEGMPESNQTHDLAKLLAHREAWDGGRPERSSGPERLTGKARIGFSLDD